MAQARVAGVSVSQVARRYDVNANMVFKWLRSAVRGGEEEPCRLCHGRRCCRHRRAGQPASRLAAGKPRSRACSSASQFASSALQHQLAGLRRHRFGTRSESIDQLELTLEEAEIARAVEAPVERLSQPGDEKGRPKRLPLPDHLPRHETALPAGAACPSCGGRLKRVGEDVTEELDYVPGASW